MVARKLRQLLHYLDYREAYLIDGDLVKVDEGTPYGLKIYPEVVEEASRIYGNYMEVFLNILYDMMRDVKRELQKSEVGEF